MQNSVNGIDYIKVKFGLSSFFCGVVSPVFNIYISNICIIYL